VKSEDHRISVSNASPKLKHLRPWLAAAAFVLAAFLLYRALRQYSVDEMLASLRSISSGRAAVAALFTAGSYLCLTGFDTLAVRYTQSDLPFSRIALASFTSLSIGHTLGFAAFSSGAVRYRFYTGWGLSRGDVGRIILFCGVTVALGLGTLAGLAAVIAPAMLAATFRLPSPAFVAACGGLLLLVVAGYVGLAALGNRPVLRIRDFELPVPTLRLAVAQVVIGTANFLLVAAVLHQLLAASAEVAYLPVAGTYAVANVAAIVSHVPGGLGVIEAVVLSLVPGTHVVGALIAFRALYYLVPFLLGSTALGVAEWLRRKRRIRG
jgi:uncharacterized membrane protein YbhN (UPF0104 family)